LGVMNCPDCGREVSDRIPACLHCGGPLRIEQPLRLEPGSKIPVAARESGKLFSAVLQGASKQYKEIRAQLPDKIAAAQKAASEAASTLKVRQEERRRERAAEEERQRQEAERLRPEYEALLMKARADLQVHSEQRESRIRGAAERRIRDAEEQRARQQRATEKTVRRKKWELFDDVRRGECLIPVFALPLGTDRGDYTLHYRFDSFIFRVRSERFVRPRLQLWAFREDIDRSRLAASVAADFSKQLRQQLQAELLPAIADKQNKAKQLGVEGPRRRHKCSRFGGSGGRISSDDVGPYEPACRPGAIVSGSARGVFCKCGSGAEGLEKRTQRLDRGADT
jgi:hypothetical protein